MTAALEAKMEALEAHVLSLEVEQKVVTLEKRVEALEATVRGLQQQLADNEERRRTEALLELRLADLSQGDLVETRLARLERLVNTMRAQ